MTDKTGLNHESPPEKNTEKQAESPTHPTQDELLEVFIGPNSDKISRVGLSFNWVALFFLYPWLFYRKLYLFGLILILAPIVLVAVFPFLKNLSIGGGIFIACTANAIYVWYAKRKIKKIQKLNLPTDQLIENVRATGGTSIAGGVFGSLVLAAMFAIPILNTMTTTLPDCNSTEVQKQTGEMLSSLLADMEKDVSGLKVYDFVEVNKQMDGLNICSFTAEIESETKTLFIGYKLTDNKDQILFQLGSTPANVTQKLQGNNEQ